MLLTAKDEINVPIAAPDGVRTSALWISSLTLYPMSHPVTLCFYPLEKNLQKGSSHKVMPAQKAMVITFKVAVSHAEKRSK